MVRKVDHLTNLIPLPYRRVSVQKVDSDLSFESLKKYFIGKEAYFATDYIVVKKDSKVAVIRIVKQKSEELFHRIESIVSIADPSNCTFCIDENVDVGNPSAMSRKADALGLQPSATLVVEGLFGHVNFLHHRNPLRLQVVDLVPPAQSRLKDLVLKAIELENFPPILIEDKMIDVNQIAKQLGHQSVMFPCRASGLTAPGGATFLDEHPPASNAVLVGCERTEQIYEHFYSKKPDRQETCPRKLVPQSSKPTLMRCCLLQNEVEVNGATATVPWGADVKHVISAIQKLCSNLGYALQE